MNKQLTRFTKSKLGLLLLNNEDTNELVIQNNHKVRFNSLLNKYEIIIIPTVVNIPTPLPPTTEIKIIVDKIKICFISTNRD